MFWLWVLLALFGLTEIFAVLGSVLISLMATRIAVPARGVFTLVDNRTLFPRRWTAVESAGHIAQL